MHAAGLAHGTTRHMMEDDDYDDFGCARCGAPLEEVSGMGMDVCDECDVLMDVHVKFCTRCRDVPSTHVLAKYPEYSDRRCHACERMLARRVAAKRAARNVLVNAFSGATL